MNEEMSREIQAIINGTKGNHRKEVERLFRNAEKVGLQGVALQQYRSGTPVEQITDNLLEIAGRGLHRAKGEEVLRTVSDNQLIEGLCNPVPLNLN